MVWQPRRQLLFGDLRSPIASPETADAVVGALGPPAPPGLKSQNFPGLLWSPASRLRFAAPPDSLRLSAFELTRRDAGRRFFRPRKWLIFLLILTSTVSGPRAR